MSNTEGKVSVVSTGNVEIDKRLGGGIPLGSLTMIEGQPDSGKSVLTQQMVWGSLRNGLLVTVLTSENTVKSLVHQMRAINLDILDYCLLGKLKIYPIGATMAKVGPEQALRRLLEAVGRQRGRGVVVVDSLTSFISHAPMEDVMGFFEGCKTYCDHGMTIVVVIHSYAVEQGMLVRLSSLCDAHLRLNIENLGERLMKSLEVAKVRGAQKATGNVVSFDVEPGWGMRIIPVSKARA
ncbi:MAG: flaH [Dehalococcoidia bacterium]|nr:flaH [Dehalococcoidia bacterium]